MIHKIRPVRATLLAALLCGVSSVSLLAQGPDGPHPGGPERHHGPPPSPLFDALDTNHDGVLSAEEIGNASASLKALLKNGATELKREDLRPMPPQHGPAEDPAEGGNEHPRDKMPPIRPHGPPPMNDEVRPDAPDKPEAAAGVPSNEEREHPHHHRRDGLPPETDPARPDAPEQPAPPRDDAAQDGPQGAGGEHHFHHGPLAKQLFDALDTNHDRVVSEGEMDHAAELVKTLVKSGMIELRGNDRRPGYDDMDPSHDGPRPRHDGHHPEDRAGE